MNLRVLTAQDASEMAEIHGRSFERGWPALDMSLHIKTDLCLGLGQPLLGFVIIRIADDQAEVLTIATDTSARRKGYGRDLIQASLERLSAQNVKTLFLDVAEDNNGAIALYRSCGFVPIGRRPAYYRRAHGRMAAMSFSISLSPNS